jgi:hypothetical protein
MTQPLWYLRHHDQIHGPFPTPVIVQYLTLGRLTPDSQVSLDAQSWFSIRDSGYFQTALEELDTPRQVQEPGWDEEREKARKRWLDERQMVEPLPENMSEHRAGESAQAAALRQDHQETQALLTEARHLKPATWIALLAGLVLAGIAAVVLWGQPEQPAVIPRLVELPDCAARPAEGVVWRGCDKRDARLANAPLRNGQLNEARLDGADLSGADLSYADLGQASLRGADLSGADLTGANLGRADLSGASLAEANLSYASLRDARLDGARLDGAQLGKATWTDGRVCHQASVSACR